MTGYKHSNNNIYYLLDNQNGIPRKATSAKVCKLTLESDDVGSI